jgi:lycopene beta-cyclase
MTYGQFLVTVLFPLVVIAASVLVFQVRRTAPKARSALGRSTAILALTLSAVALVYTTPWDSWLIRNSVWGYPPGTIIATVFSVPVEEYTFMVGTTLFTGCWTLTWALGRIPGADQPGSADRASAVAPADRDRRRRALAATGWLVAAFAGVAATVMQPHVLYLGSQLAWFGLPLALQAACGADRLRAHRRLRLAGLATTPVLWAADALGINTGAWHIGSQATVGLSLFGLPLEEATFFLLVNLLIVNSVVLHLDPRMRGRIAAISAGAWRPSTTRDRAFAPPATDDQLAASGSMRAALHQTPRPEQPAGRTERPPVPPGGRPYDG